MKSFDEELTTIAATGSDAELWAHCRDEGVNALMIRVGNESDMASGIRERLARRLPADVLDRISLIDEAAIGAAVAKLLDPRITAATATTIARGEIERHDAFLTEHDIKLWREGEDLCLRIGRGDVFRDPYFDDLMMTARELLAEAA